MSKKKITSKTLLIYLINNKIKKKTKDRKLGIIRHGW